MNHIDLNKTRLKDSYPLLNIDQLVDATTRHELLTFMDDRTPYAFITKEGLLCYKVIPFELKIMGNTYWHMIN